MSALTSVSKGKDIHYWEIDFNDGYSMCIKSTLECMTEEMVEEFILEDARKHSGVATIYGPCKREEIEPFYDMTNESIWPVFE